MKNTGNVFGPLRIARRLLPLALAALLLSTACQKSPQTAPPNNAAQTANAGGGAATPAPAQPSACDLLFYPVKEGAERRYRITYSDKRAQPVTFTESSAGVRADSYTQRLAFPGLTVETGWRCTGEGLLALEFANYNFAQKGAGFKFETLERSGVTLPPDERWREGETWASRYEVKAQTTAGPDNRATGEGQGTVDVASRVVGRELVAVAAGSYDTLRVDSTVTLKLTVKAGPATVPVNVNIKSSAWYAPTVGMVKSTAGGDLGAATTELVSSSP